MVGRFEPQVEGMPSEDLANRANRFHGVDSAPIRTANRVRVSFEAAAGRIVEHGAGLSSERFPISQLRIEGGCLIADGREFLLGSEGIRRLCNRFRAPADYMQGLSS